MRSSSNSCIGSIATPRESFFSRKSARRWGRRTTLREGRVDKRYLVLVKGTWSDARRQVELPLTKFLTADGERRVRVERDGGKTARTVFYLRKGLPEPEPAMTLLEAELHTGRTHQIRVHLTHLGFPLAGDDKYGDFPWNKTLGRRGL